MILIVTQEVGSILKLPSVQLGEEEWDRKVYASPAARESHDGI